MSLRWLREVDRRGAWPVALVAGLWLASVLHPVSWTDVLSLARGLPFSYGDVYGELHARPFAYCDTYDDQRAVAVQEAVAFAEAVEARGMLRQLRAYDERMRWHYAEDCRVPWRVYQNPANFQKVFSQNYVLYFAIHTLGLTEIHLGLVAMLLRWAGVVTVVLLCTYAWRSVLAPAVAMLLTSWALSHSFAGGLGVPVPGLAGVTALPGHYLYPSVTAALALGVVRVVPRGWDALRHPAFWLLPIAFALHTWVYVLLDPPVARLLTWLVLGTLAVAALGTRHWARLACVVLAVSLQSMLWGWYTAPSRDIYSVVTTYDHVSSEAYTPFMMYMGLLERPSPFGLFYMDEVFGWGYEQDPVAGVPAPHLTVHHSYAETGRRLFWNAVTTEPGAVMSAVARRLLVQVVHRPLWYAWDLRIDRVYTFTLLAIMAVSGMAFVFPRWLWLLTPLTLGVLLNQFAVNTAMTLVHTHARWNQLGVALMFGAVPVYVFAAVGMLGDWRRHGLPPWVRRATGSVRMRLLVLVLLVAAAASAAEARSVLESERRYLRIWTALHLLSVDGLEIEPMIESLEEERRRTGDPDGTLAMWAASLLYFYDARYSSALPFDEAIRDATQVRRIVEPEEFTYVGEGSRHDGVCWRLDGAAGGAYSYLLASRPQGDVADARLAVDGDIESGGITVGLQVAGRWVEAHNVTQPGPFSLVIEPGVEGPFDIVIANNERDGAASTRACLAQLAWVEPSAAARAARSRDQLRNLREAYYRQALEAAPDNHHYPFLARFLQVRNWETYLRQGIQRFPDAPYVPGALAALWYHGPRELSPADRAGWLYRTDLARRYEVAVADHLRASGAANPLYEATPAAAGDAVERETLTDADGRRVLRLRLPAGASVSLGEQATWQTHAVQVVAYVRVVEGRAEAALSLHGADGWRDAASLTVTPETQESGGRYLRFDGLTQAGEARFALSLRALEASVIEVADVYPMLSSPAGYYQSLPQRQGTPR